MAWRTRCGSSGIGRGDRVGVRIPSGTTDLYVAIIGILMAGAAYVPVDHDDPDERAQPGVRRGGRGRRRHGRPGDPRRSQRRGSRAGGGPAS